MKIIDLRLKKAWMELCLPQLAFMEQITCTRVSASTQSQQLGPAPRNLFNTLNSLLCPPPPPHSIFTSKTKTISSQFSVPQTQEHKPTTSTAKTPLVSFGLLTEAEESKVLHSSLPTTCPLDPIPSHLLQAISPTLLPALTHIINMPHCIRAGLKNLV